MKEKKFVQERYVWKKSYKTSFATEEIEEKYTPVVWTTIGSKAFVAFLDEDVSYCLKYRIDDLLSEQEKTFER